MIRPLDRSEYNWLEQALKAFFAELTAGARQSMFAPDAARVFAGLYLGGGSLQAGPRLLAVAMIQNDAPVALLLARIQDRPARKPAKALSIDAAYTLPDFRQAGHMQALLDHALNFAREQKVERVELGTPAEGPALEFWRKRGFADEFVQLGREP